MVSERMPQKNHKEKKERMKKKFHELKRIIDNEKTWYNEKPAREKY